MLQLLVLHTPQVVAISWSLLLGFAMQAPKLFSVGEMLVTSPVVVLYL